MPVLGFWDLLILLFVALLIFGPKRLPTMGRSLGSGIRDFREAITGRHERLEQQALPPGSSDTGDAPAAEPVQREHDTVL